MKWLIVPALLLLAGVVSAANGEYSAIEFQISDLRSMISSAQLESRNQFTAVNMSLNRLENKQPELTRDDLAKAKSELVAEMDARTSPERMVFPVLLAIMLGFSASSAFWLYWRK